MNCDNQSTVFFCANDKLSGASKYIDLKYRVVKDRNRDRTIKIEDVSTTANIADPLTKRFITIPLSETCPRYGFG